MTFHNGYKAFISIWKPHYGQQKATLTKEVLLENRLQKRHRKRHQISSGKLVRKLCSTQQHYHTRTSHNRLKIMNSYNMIS
jgi:hypothetical protein